MKFHKTTEYAIRVMVFLAEGRQERFSVNQLHRILHIPYKYLGRLMHQLAAADLVDVAQGKQGGYKVTNRQADIYLYQIVGVVEGLEDHDRCVLGFESCSDSKPCSLHHLWLERRIAIQDMLYNTSLEDLKSRQAGIV